MGSHISFSGECAKTYSCTWKGNKTKRSCQISLPFTSWWCRCISLDPWLIRSASNLVIFFKLTEAYICYNCKKKYRKHSFDAIFGGTCCKNWLKIPAITKKTSKLKPSFSAQTTGIILLSFAIKVQACLLDGMELMTKWPCILWIKR